MSNPFAKYPLARLALWLVVGNVVLQQCQYSWSMSHYLTIIGPLFSLGMIEAFVFHHYRLNRETRKWWSTAGMRLMLGFLVFAYYIVIILPIDPVPEVEVDLNTKGPKRIFKDKMLEMPSINFYMGDAG